VHSFVRFTARHLVVGRVRGRFDRFAGTVTIAKELTATALDVTVETAGISTLFAARDEDLRSERLFDIEAEATLSP
jgi:polyisoprenoid-binding protein YceI